MPGPWERFGLLRRSRVGNKDQILSDLPPADDEKESRTKPEANRFPCENCGSFLEFAPGVEALACPYCGYENTIPEEAQPIREFSLKAFLEKHGEEQLQDDHPRTSKCRVCGASFDQESGVYSTSCPFCGSPQVEDAGQLRLVRPEAVVPFLLGLDEAKNSSRGWLKKLWFAPNAFKRHAREGLPLLAAYIPHWTFDAWTESRYRGQRGDAYYVTRQIRAAGGKLQTRSIRKVRWRSTSGQVNLFFDDVLILAASTLPPRLANALEPWDLAALRPYKPDYLSGVRAELYKLGAGKGWTLARNIMEKRIREAVREDIGGDEQRIHALDTRFSRRGFKLVLLPLYIAAFRYRGKSYRYLVNAQTGRVKGEHPLSWIKVGFAVLFGLLAVLLIAYLYAVNQGVV